jgi:hypothetical protein
MKMPKEVNKICRSCKQLRSKHEDWVATGEYAENAVCPTQDMDAQGRYRTISWFVPMSNLEYLEALYERKQTL